MNDLEEYEQIENKTQKRNKSIIQTDIMQIIYNYILKMNLSVKTRADNMLVLWMKLVWGHLSAI